MAVLRVVGGVIEVLLENDADLRNPQLIVEMLAAYPAHLQVVAVVSEALVSYLEYLRVAAFVVEILAPADELASPPAAPGGYRLPLVVT